MKANFATKLLLLMAVLLAACGPSNSFDADGAPLQAWIDAPLTGSALPVANYTLIFSGASQEGTVDGFEIWVNGVEEANVGSGYSTSQGEAQYSFGQYDWLPAAPGNYLIQVRALSGEMSSEFAEANVIVGNLVQDDGAAATTPTPGEDTLMAIPIQDVNCREGNSNQFDIADTLFEGEEYIPQGRGFDNLWVRFAGPATSVNCWVFVENLTMLLNDVDTALADIPESILPYLNYPPTATPTFTPEPSSTPTPTPAPECSDGIDNDGDGDTDYPNDGRCLSPGDNSESG